MLKKFRSAFSSDVPAAIRLRAIARHYWQKLKANTLGRLFISDAGRKLRSQVAAIRPLPPHPKVRVAITAHVFYLDLAKEIIALRDIFPDPVPVFLTVPLDRAEELSRIVAGFPDVVLFPSENRGRDIAPFFSLLESGALDGFDAVLKLHTKRSPHLIDGDLRRKLLFAMLCGERSAAYRTLKAFEEPDTGLVGWRDSYRSDPVFWMANKARVHEIAERMNAEDFVKLGFFEGSMFWFRPKALDALRELRLKSDAFEAEAGQLDGTLHHAIERCFSIAAWGRGYTVRDLRGHLL
ncbi:rhamnan synthesis F family protein [Bosea rubneri]|uniref:Rhamnan synthesis F family protein n=1 Tax=Bosea rubneri TaxID=3075434 RepID=A0ABU3SFM4_9HYPH|nr:rhamnan synthesis F family protein [Bosea sp. ZW T0_25]MDU0343593.1 rhamnan synthesis F family protein [Bosea sp. ZW T0_25]